ncbi:MAG: hypothetical protein EZS28_050652, partial [Streblomastix strix]
CNISHYSIIFISFGFIVLNVSDVDEGGASLAKDLAYIKPFASNRIRDQIGGDVNLDKILQYSFGTTMITSRSEQATSLAFDGEQKNRVRAVSLDGDVADPGGVIQGGYRAQGQSALDQMQQLDTIIDEKEKEKV